MTRSIALALLLLAFALPALASDPAAEVTALEHQWAAAQARGDSAPVAAMLADTFVNTDVSGHSYGRDRILSNMKGGHWDVNQIDDVKVNLYGSTAIVTGGWTGKGVDGDGTRIDRRERWTDTWIRMPSGNWQCVASHQSEVK